MSRRAAAALVFLALLVSAAIWVWPPDRAQVDTVDPAALAEALAPADLPLSAADTDVILVIGCTFRRDRIGAYGGAPGATPFLDALAAAGALFEGHYAQAPWTRPSVGTLVTGRWPRPLHLDNPGKAGSLSLVLDEGFVTLAETFQAAGYRTVGAVSNPNARTIFGFSQGFDVYDEPGGRYRRGTEIPSGDELVDRILGELDATPAGQRFFGELLFTTTHEPRRPAPRYQLLFREEAPRLRLYDAALRALDAQVARLYVEAHARRRNLLFVVVADHGEGLRLPKHHGPGHGNHLYDSTLHIPLLVHHPALPGGRRIGGLSMNIDVMPTILDLLGLAPRGPLDGASEAAALRGTAAAAVHPRVFAETYYVKSKKSTVIEPDWQLIHDMKKQTTRLFARSDVGANDEQGAAQPAVVTRLAATLGDWEGEMTAVAAQGAAVEAAPDAATAEMLQSLGYVEEEE